MLKFKNTLEIKDKLKVKKEKIKSYLKAHRFLIRANLTNFECPECCKKYNLPEYPVRVRVLYDEKYHKHKFYLKCRDCKLTTPAYEDPKELINVWEDLWISAEIKIVESI